MVTLTPDPANPDRLLLTATVSLYLDRLLVESLSGEIEAAIRAQAIADLQTNQSVKKAVFAAAQKKLLAMLGAEEQPAQVPQS